MAESIMDKRLSEEERTKLRLVINATVIALQHVVDTSKSMKDNVAEIAKDLDINASEIMETARTLHKQNFAEKQAKVDATGEILAELGYEIIDTPEG